MSFFSSRNRKVPYIDDSVFNPASVGLSEPRRSSWAFAIGERRPSTDPPRGRRLSRADLPDVDFSRAVPVERGSRLSRLVAWLGLSRRPVLPVADEGRVLRPLSDQESPVRHENNIVPINRAA